MNFRVVISQDEDGVFVASVPSLRGCHSQGATLEKARENIKEAIAGWLEMSADYGDPIPQDDSEIIETSVQVLEPATK